ncbi:hypothetical protein [Streptomyces sp. NBS 14/10]
MYIAEPGTPDYDAMTLLDMTAMAAPQRAKNAENPEKPTPADHRH